LIFGAFHQVAHPVACLGGKAQKTANRAFRINWSAATRNALCFLKTALLQSSAVCSIKITLKKERKQKRIS
jgi:hypothetical protein